MRKGAEKHQKIFLKSTKNGPETVFISEIFADFLLEM